MVTVHVAVIMEPQPNIDYWVNKATRDRIREEAVTKGKLVYAFTIQTDTIVNLEHRLLVAAEYWPMFHANNVPVSFIH